MMVRYEYKVVAAPRKGLKAKGMRSVEDRFAHALEVAMNTLGAEGWEYLRADTLPCEEREGLLGKATHFHHMLVFRRPQAAEEPAGDVAAHVAEAIADSAAPALIEDKREDAPRSEPPVSRPATTTPPADETDTPEATDTAPDQRTDA